MRNRCLFTTMALLAICLFLPQKSFGQSTISCSSDDEGRHTCAVDTRGGVRLATQHSGSACTEGYSWGSDDRGIWVDHGCRADFTVGLNQDRRDNDRNTQYDGNRGQTMACGSDDEGRHTCAVDTRGGVRLATQHSGSACTEGYSWGSDNQGIWVDHGCRADFTVGGSEDYRDTIRRDANRNDHAGDGDYRDDPSRSSRQLQRFTCNSDDMRKHSCPVDTRDADVRLVSQHSDARCTRGYSWGTNRRAIWVDHGCRADFEVTSRHDHQTWR